MESFVFYAAVMLVLFSFMGGLWRFLDMVRDIYLITRGRRRPQR